MDVHRGGGNRYQNNNYRGGGGRGRHGRGGQHVFISHIVLEAVQ
jgi:hypothetical protein